MTRSLKPFIILLGVLSSIAVQAQSGTDSTNQTQNRQSIFRIGYTPFNRGVSDGFDVNLNLEWEKPFTSHLSFDLTFYKDLSQTRSEAPDVYDGALDFLTNDLNSGEAHNILSSLSIGVNYYFQPGRYDGLYASLRLNNFLTHSHRSTPLGFGALSVERNVIDTTPMPGLYLGYRKVFKNNFFIDGRAGYLPGNGFQNVSSREIRNLDFRLSIGYQFRFGKRKGNR